MKISLNWPAAAIMGCMGQTAMLVKARMHWQRVWCTTCFTDVPYDMQSPSRLPLMMTAIGARRQNCFLVLRRKHAIHVLLKQPFLSYCIWRAQLQAHVQAIHALLKQLNREWWVQKLSNMSTITREWVALHSVRNIAFPHVLLKGHSAVASAPSKPEIPEVGCL